MINYVFSSSFFPFLLSLIYYPGFEVCISTYAQLPVHLVWYLSKYDASFHVGMTLKSVQGVWTRYRTCMASSVENKSFYEVPKYVIKYKASMSKVDEIHMLYTCMPKVAILKVV